MRGWIPKRIYALNTLHPYGLGAKLCSPGQHSALLGDKPLDSPLAPLSKHISVGLPLLPPEEEEARGAKETLSPLAVPKAFSQRHNPMRGLFLVMPRKANASARAELRTVGSMDLGWGLSLAGCRSIYLTTSCSRTGWRQSMAAACSTQAGLQTPGSSTSDARAGSRSWDPNPLIFLSYCSLLLLFMCHGARRGTLQP